MSEITDYASLSAAIIDHTTRTDLETPMPRFVQMAESAMKRRLRSLDMETTATVATTTGILTLPANFLALKTIALDDTWQTPLKAAGLSASPDALDGTYRISGNTLTILPEPSEEVDVTYTYVAAFTPLADGSNWIIEDHPDAYFYGTLAQAYAHYRDMEGLAVADRAFNNVLDDIAATRNRDRYGSSVLAPHLVQQVAGGRC